MHRSNSDRFALKRAPAKRPPARQPIPRSIKPMLAMLSSCLPANPEKYSFEFKWDGIRALTYWDGRSVRIESRNQLDITHRYPELRNLADALGSQSAILDGEIVAPDEDDRPSFPLLQHRMHANGPAINILAAKIPIYYIIFDLLYVDGRALMDRPLSERRQRLEELALAGSHWRVSPAIVGEGSATLETAEKHQLEGIVAKRLNSPYEPGRRSPAWLKVKRVLRQEFVVGGWTTEHGSPRRLGALQVGYYDAAKPGKLQYAGGVGSGFTQATLASMWARLQEIRSTESPFAERLPRRDVHFVQPRIVIEVEYRRWPAGGRIQQASFKGVRTDKRAAEVVREDRSCRT
jgi:bifunctional non-homologous end joining protein LigD